MQVQIQQISEEKKQSIFDKLQRLARETGNRDVQKQFILASIKVVPTKRKTVGTDSRRYNSFFHSFTVHGVQKQVCKKNFHGILDLRVKFVLNALKNKSPISSSQPDLRNKSCPRNQKARLLKTNQNFQQIMSSPSQWLVPTTGDSNGLGNT